MKDDPTKECCHHHNHHHHGDSSPLYGLGFVGALLYFLQGANTFTKVIIGIGKAIVWPAILLFKVLGLLHI